MKKRILVFSAHPDDAEIGMGGTIAKYIKYKYDVLVVFFRVPKIPLGIKVRANEAKFAMKILGANLKILFIQSRKKILMQYSLIQKIEEIINGYNPDEIYTHWNYSSHQEHRAVTKAVISATRKNRCSVYMYEQIIPEGIITQTFRAQMFIDITFEVNKKLNSVKTYASQYEINGCNQWIDAISSRAKYRGYQIGVGYAEVFEIVKEIKVIN